MKIDGAWIVSMETPIGRQEGELHLVSEGDVLSGQMVQMGNATEIENGRIGDDGTISWTTSVRKPMKIKVEIAGHYNGSDEITGKAGLGIIGSAPLKATRA